MMRRYAERTAVPVERTQGEIRSLLAKHEASGFMFGEQDDRALVGFVMRNRQIRFILPLVKSKARGGESERKAAAETRRRWRALLLVLKAKLEAVSSGIIEFEREFLAHIVTNDGITVGDRILSRLQEVIEQKIPNLLGDGTGTS